MAPSASAPAPAEDPVVASLRKTLTSESEPLARRYRALFSLKHLACQSSIPAIKAIAAGFSSPSVLLKHELAYCLGQSKNLTAAPYLRDVLENKNEDAMCRHEAAEALGALGDAGSLDVLRQLRDASDEPDVVKETCELAIARIEWEHSEARKQEKLRPRYTIRSFDHLAQKLIVTVISHLSTPHHPWNNLNLLKASRNPSWTPLYLSSCDTELCLLFGT